MRTATAGDGEDPNRPPRKRELPRPSSMVTRAALKKKKKAYIEIGLTLISLLIRSFGENSETYELSLELCGPIGDLSAEIFNTLRLERRLYEETRSVLTNLGRAASLTDYVPTTSTEPPIRAAIPDPSPGPSQPVIKMEPPSPPSEPAEPYIPTVNSSGDPCCACGLPLNLNIKLEAVKQEEETEYVERVPWTRVRADTPCPSTSSSEATTILREEEEEEETRTLLQPLVETQNGDLLPEPNADLLYLASDPSIDRWLSQVIKQEENKD